MDWATISDAVLELSEGLLAATEKSTMAQVGLGSSGPDPDWLYRLMVWGFTVQDLLGIDRPERHLAEAPIRVGMTVVDWGCGPGRYTIPVARLVGEGGKVFALDVQPLALKIVRQKAAAASLTNVETVLLDSYETPLPGSSVDTALLIDTFHAIEDPDALLCEIHRILKPEGFLFMDPGHMNKEIAMGRVAASGFFDVVEPKGGYTLLAPRQKREAGSEWVARSKKLEARGWY